MRMQYFVNLCLPLQENPVVSVVKKPTHQLDDYRSEEFRPLLGKSQIARQYGVSVRTIDNWMARRVVPYTKIGRTVRFDKALVSEALEKFRVASN